MFKKRIYVFGYVFLLAFFAVYLCFKIQERDMIIQLNNHNLSPDAYVVKFKQNITMYSLNQKLGSSNLSDLQVHYQDQSNQKITYFYGKGDYLDLPIISGKTFNEKAFSSTVETLIAGKDWQDKFYKPKDQNYLKINQHYLPVIGVMGDSYKSKLDSQLFIAPSVSQQQAASVKDFRVVIDGSKALTAAKLKQTLGQVTVKRMVNNNFLAVHESWLASHLAQALGLGLIVILLMVEVYIWLLTSTKYYHESNFLKIAPKQFLFAEWRSFSICQLLGLGLGSLAAAFYYNLMSYGLVAVVIIGLLLLSSVGFYILLKKKMQKIE